MGDVVRVDDAEMQRKSIEIDGESLDVLHNPEMSDAQWFEYKQYLQSHPDEARRLLEQETNPDLVRRKNTMNCLADVWKKSMGDDPDDFARKIKALEEDEEFRPLFEDLKAYRWDDVGYHLENKDLMMKVSRRMGGVPREAKLKAEKFRKTPLTLQEACKNGDLRALQRYFAETEPMKEDRDIDAKDHKGITCLGYAIGANRQSIAQLLIETGADPKQVDTMGNTGLHYAAAYGRKDMADYLISTGLDVNAQNSAGMTPLACATRNKQKATIQFIGDKGGS